MADKSLKMQKQLLKRLLKSLMFSKGSQSTSAPVRVKSKDHMAHSEADNKELWYRHCYGSYCRRIYLCP